MINYIMDRWKGVSYTHGNAIRHGFVIRNRTIVIGGDAMTASTTVNNKNEEEETDWDDIEYLRDANNNTMVDYKNLYDLNIGKVYNPNFVDNADWFLDSSNYENHVDYYLIPYNYNWYFYSDISAPWYGCEAQSKAMLVTAKKYNETGDSKYLEFSKKVFNGLNSPVVEPTTPCLRISLRIRL